jgi:hypothetical protein
MTIKRYWYKNSEEYADINISPRRKTRKLLTMLLNSQDSRERRYLRAGLKTGKHVLKIQLFVQSM